MQCPSCGANLPPNVDACPFCKAATPMATHRAEVEAAARMVREAEDHVRAERDADKALADSAKKALLWSLAGVVCACTLVPSVIAVVLGLRARGIAAKGGRVAPTSATVAIVLGALQVAGAIGLWAFVAVDAAAQQKRRAALTQRIDRDASADHLEQPIACAIVELRLLEDGYRAASQANIKGFSCPGKLTQVGDRATLEDVRFRTGHDEPETVVRGCLKRGARWMLVDLREDRTCEDTSPAPPRASGSASSKARAR